LIRNWTTISPLAEAVAEKQGAVAMIVEQGNDILIIQDKDPKVGNILIGLFFFAWVILICWLFLEKPIGIEGLIMVPVGLGFLVFAVYMIFIIPCIFIFDLSKGKLTVVHRIRFCKFTWESQYALSEIKYLQLVTKITDKRKYTYFVSLAIGEPYMAYKQEEKILRLTGDKSDMFIAKDEAKRVASFLGLPVRETTVHEEKPNLDLPI
jgi:hypothetical protein